MTRSLIFVFVCAAQFHTAFVLASLCHSVCLPVCFLCQASERPRASAAECSSFFFRTLCFSLIPVLFLCPNNSYFLLCSELNMWSEPPDCELFHLWLTESEPASAVPGNVPSMLHGTCGCQQQLWRTQVGNLHFLKGAPTALFSRIQLSSLFFFSFCCCCFGFFLFPLFEMYISCSFFNFSLFKFSVLMAPGYF